MGNSARLQFSQFGQLEQLQLRKLRKEAPDDQPLHLLGMFQVQTGPLEAKWPPKRKGLAGTSQTIPSIAKTLLVYEVLLRKKYKAKR
jgi:hypothetical protein